MTAQDTHTSAKPGCTAPALGGRASHTLGRPLSRERASHVDTCVACQLERAAYAALDAHAIPPGQALLERILRALSGQTSK
jgi:hypothetical protein